MFDFLFRQPKKKKATRSVPPCCDASVVDVFLELVPDFVGFFFGGGGSLKSGIFTWPWAVER